MLSGKVVTMQKCLVATAKQVTFMQEHEANHSPPTSAKVKKMWMYTSTLPYAFMV
jgi:hypothetical protein